MVRIIWYMKVLMSFRQYSLIASPSEVRTRVTREITRSPSASSVTAPVAAPTTPPPPQLQDESPPPPQLRDESATSPQSRDESATPPLRRQLTPSPAPSPIPSPAPSPVPSPMKRTGSGLSETSYALSPKVLRTLLAALHLYRTLLIALNPTHLL